jgi:TolB-like protein
MVEMAEGYGDEKARGSMPAAFISYASQDVAVADAIVETLERHGVTCWIAPRDVKPGAVYADAIVRAIGGAQALVLVLSQNSVASSHVGKEIERASSKRRPIIALRIDEAPLSPALEYFLSESQWVDARAKGIDAALIKLIAAIRDRPRDAPAFNSPVPPGTSAVKAPAASPDLRRNRRVLTAVFAAVVLVLGWLLADKFLILKHVTAPHPTASAAQETRPSSTPATPATFSPPPHSIAVLPFVNMSGDKEQEYFSEGLTEELLNSLARIDELQVAARTSSFSFQGEHPDIAAVAHKLNVAAVLEGSVRRSAHTLRITAQLVNGITGFHLWSQTYDRDLGDELALQTEIANAVASALKVTLLADAAAKIELGGTRIPAAFDAYLQGSKAFHNRHETKDVESAITEYSVAIRLDPNYARAFVARSIAIGELESWWTTSDVTSESNWNRVRADASKAVALAPELGEGHMALAEGFIAALDFTRAIEEYERAVTLASGNAQVLRYYGLFATLMGRTDTGIAAARRAVLLDPLNRDSYGALAQTLSAAHYSQEAIAAYREASLLDPGYSYPYRWASHYALGNYEDARALCEARPDDWGSQVCLAVTYEKLGRHAAAESELSKYKAGNANHDDWYQYAQIYAQWGDTAKALSCLEEALRLRHQALEYLKVDSLLDPLRKDSRFQLIDRALKFPPQ